MPPSLCPLALDDFPSSPSSAWSFGTGSPSLSSETRDIPSPLTPDSCFSPIPTTVSPDEFSREINRRLDKLARGLSQSSVSPSAASSHSMVGPGEDTVKARTLRNPCLQDSMHDRFESSPPPRPRNLPCLPPVPLVNEIPWEVAQPLLSASADPLSDPLRCSLLIHEVSLLVGLDADDDRILLGDSDLVPDGLEHLSDTLPLNLPSTKSLASCKQRNAIPLHHTYNPTSIDPHGGIVAPTPRYKSPNAVRASLSPHRRQGQVFCFEPTPPDIPRPHAIDLDETFIHPREPPPKPTMPNRCSSLDRLERSLLKLEAYAPHHHRKSQSAPIHVVQRKDKCPSLPPPRRLKKQHSHHERPRRSPSNPAFSCSSSNLPQSAPLHRHTTPLAFLGMPPYDGSQREEDVVPKSFMDMDIPQTEAPQKPQTPHSSRKMKSLIRVARRLSQGMIAWGKNLAGSTKPSVTA